MAGFEKKSEKSKADSCELLTHTMVKYEMSGVNRYCGDCIKSGEFLPLKFVMMNIDSGLWMCPKDGCVFPMASGSLKDYMEDNLTTERVLLLTGKKSSSTEDIFQTRSNYSSVIESSIHNAKVDWRQNGSTTDSRNESLNTPSTKSKDDKSSVTSGNNLSLAELDNDSVKLSDKVSTLYPLWENQNLLCWLDAILSVLVLNITIQILSQKDAKNLLHRFYDHYKSQNAVFQFSKEYTSIKQPLDEYRMEIFRFLQPKILSSFSEEDSPLRAIQLLIKTSVQVYEQLEMKYQSDFQCTVCDFTRKDGFCEMLVYLPNTPQEFNMSDNFYYTRPCYKCGAENQKTKHQIEKYPESLFVYFDEGVSTRGKYWKHMAFTTPDGERYIVTQIVQYVSKKKHFVVWSYSYEEKLWIEVDDLKEPVVSAKYKYPKCRPRELQLMVWEKVSLLKAQLNEESQQRTRVTPPGDVQSLSSSNGHPPSRKGVSGFSSRANSLTSTDGISPTLTPTGSGLNSPLMGPSASSHQSEISQGPMKKGLLHVPRYKPYVPRSKQKPGNEDLQQNSPIADDTVLNALDINKANIGQRVDENISNQNVEIILESESTDLTVIKKEQFSSTGFFDDPHGVIADELDEFLEEMLQQKSSTPQGESSRSSNEHTTTAIDEGGKLTTPDEHTQFTNKEHVDFSIQDSVTEFKISDDELDDILNG